MKRVNLKNVIWKEGKYFVVQCLNVDISSFGRTRKEALSNIAEAVELYFDGEKKPAVLDISKTEIVTTTAQYA